MAAPTPMSTKVKEWPKYPNPKEDGAAKGWDWTKKESIPKQKLELALAALKESFGNDDRLSGMSLREISEETRKALDTFKESFKAPEKPESQLRLQRDCWQAIQMASQEVYLQKNKIGTEEIAYQHRWRLAVLPNSEDKLKKIEKYKELSNAKDTGYPRDTDVADLLGRKPKGKSVEPDKTITLKDLIHSLKMHDFAVIMSISKGTVIDMVTSKDSSNEEVEELRAAIEEIQQWFEDDLKLIIEMITLATKIKTKP